MLPVWCPAGREETDPKRPPATGRGLMPRIIAVAGGYTTGLRCCAHAEPMAAATAASYSRR